MSARVTKSSGDSLGLTRRMTRYARVDQGLILNELMYKAIYILDGGYSLVKELGL